MKTTIHCDERITNIRNTIYVKLFWGIIREYPKVCVNLQTDVR